MNSNDKKGEKTDKVITSQEFLTAVIKDPFGSFIFSDTKNPILPEISNNRTIGRTYFLDRMEKECAINKKTVQNIMQIYNEVFYRSPNCDMYLLTESLADRLEKLCEFDIQFLKFFRDDNTELRDGKAMGWYTLIQRLSYKFIDVPSVPISTLRNTMELISRKALAIILYSCEGTYTQEVIKLWEHEHENLYYGPYGIDSMDAKREKEFEAWLSQEQTESQA